MNRRMHSCSRCGQPIDKTRPHWTLTIDIEWLVRGSTTVIEPESIEYRHRECGAPTRVAASDRRQPPPEARHPRPLGNPDMHTAFAPSLAASPDYQQAATSARHSRKAATMPDKIADALEWPEEALTMAAATLAVATLLQPANATAATALAGVTGLAAAMTVMAIRWFLYRFSAAGRAEHQRDRQRNTPLPQWQAEHADPTSGVWMISPPRGYPQWNLYAPGAGALGADGMPTAEPTDLFSSLDGPGTEDPEEDPQPLDQMATWARPWIERVSGGRVVEMVEGIASFGPGGRCCDHAVFARVEGGRP